MGDRTPPKFGSRYGQFRISTVLSWTAVLAVAFTVVLSEGHGEISEGTFVVALFLFPALTCIPFLVDQIIEPRRRGRNVLEFSTFSKTWLVLFVGVYSMLMFLLATNTFNAEWKGHKGPHWIYYVLEGYAGMTLWPSYLFGGVMFMVAVCNAKLATRFPVPLMFILIQTVISFWYTYACIAMRFAPGELWIVPGSCGVCYGLYAVALFKYRDWSFADVKEYWVTATVAIVAFVTSVVAKCPLAKAYYDQLPDEPPDTCFIVTAATRGHRNVVQTWYDESRRGVVNQQLINFWAFESWLRSAFPTAHRRVRKVYNFVGPMVATLIVFKWQADIVYWLLKPVEFVVNTIRKIADRNSR